jgi:hypothetical protein
VLFALPRLDNGQIVMPPYLNAPKICLQLRNAYKQLQQALKIWQK